jgi:hypothetical protein
MFNLSDRNISYLLISPEKNSDSQFENSIVCEKICNTLYSKDYTVIPITGYFNGVYEKAFISISSNDDNNDLRFDSIYLMDNFNQNFIIVKYKGDDIPTKILPDGSEKPMDINIYDSNESNKIFLHNGISFSFVEKKRYFFPKSKSDLKSGMIVEYFSNNRWTKKTISNIESEYEKMFKLLIKYEKVRVEYI